MEDVAGDPSVSSEVAGDERDVARPVAPRQSSGRNEGPLRMFLVLASQTGRFGDLECEEAPPDWPSGEGYVLAGVALASAWSLRGPQSEAMDKAHFHMRRVMAKECRHAREILGFIDYPVLEAAGLQEPPLVKSPADAIVQCGRSADTLVNLTKPGGMEPLGAHRLGDLLRTWRADHGIKNAMVIVSLAPPIAGLLFRGEVASLHTAPITRKVARMKVLLSPTEPPQEVVRSFLQEAGATTTKNSTGGTGTFRLPKWADTMLEPDLVLEWLDSSGFIKDLRSAPLASASFARLLARSGKVSATELHADLQQVSYTTLRGARIKLDVASMMIWREMWASMLTKDPDNLHLYLYCDSSPQRGAEFFASSVDVFDGEMMQRWLLPCISLDASLMDAAGKTLALLWQVFLVAGPEFHLVRAFCSKVRSITTDMGTERMIVDSADLLGVLFNMVAPKHDLKREPKEEMMWPQAFHVPGWKHAWDLLLQRGLSTLKWFPMWLSRFKAVIAFFRVEGHRSTMATHLRRNGMGGLAEMVERVSLPSFAQWRWTTLHDCLRALLPCLASLSQQLDPKHFAKSKDGVAFASVVAAFASGEWHRQTAWVNHFCGTISTMMAWGSGCSCHEEELKAGKAVTCHRKGRRLAEAQGYLQNALNEMLAEAESWHEEQWGLGHKGLLELQGVIRATYHLAQRKFEWLGKVPYLLAKLDQKGILEECERQWAAKPASEHHRVTQLFMAKGGPLRADLDKVSTDGVSPRLEAAIGSLAMVPFDDGINEGPHAQAHRLAQHARRAGWPWVAASMRLKQNIQDARVLAPSLDLPLKVVWSTWTSVLRVGGDLRRGQRIKRQKFIDYIYRMSFCHEAPLRPKVDGEDGHAEDDGVGSGDDADIELGVVESKAGKGARQRGRKGRGRASDGPAAARRRQGLGPKQGAPLVDLELSKLLRQYLAASLEVHSFFSLEVADGDGVRCLFYQILAVDPKGIFVKTDNTQKGGIKDAGVFEVSAQPYQEWLGHGGSATSASIAVECFPFDNPCMIDLLKVGGCSASARAGWRKWKTGPADVDGCILLQSPEPLRPACRLEDPKVPVLALLDALGEQGFSPVEDRVRHTDAGDKRYDGRSIAGKRCYLQCVLAFPELQQAGVAAFASGRPGIYYALLLKSKRLPPEGASASECKRLLAKCTGDALSLAVLEREAIARPLLPLPAPASAEPLPIDDDEVAGDPDVEMATEPPPVPVADEVVGDEAGASEAGPEASERGHEGIPHEIMGQRVSRIKGRHDVEWSYYDRISVRCCNAHHHNCTKSRSLQLGSAEFGPRAAEYFLGAWLLASGLPADQHRRFAPTKAEMRAYAESL